MKLFNKILVLFSFLLVFMLGSCSGSESYRGNWKAMDSKGQKFEIHFDAKSFVVTDIKGNKEKYEYTQNAVNIENGVATYGINLQDGMKYQINFPNTADETIGLIKDENGVPVYTISRNEYIAYQDIFKLK